MSSSPRTSPVRASGVRAVPSVPDEELIARDEVDLDITWLEDDTLEDPDGLPAPDVLIARI
jgi:type I restriction enzyme M protein